MMFRILFLVVALVGLGSLIRSVDAAPKAVGYGAQPVENLVTDEYPGIRPFETDDHVDSNDHGLWRRSGKTPATQQNQPVQQTQQTQQTQATQQNQPVQQAQQTQQTQASQQKQTTQTQPQIISTQNQQTQQTRQQSTANQQSTAQSSGNGQYTQAQQSSSVAQQPAQVLHYTTPHQQTTTQAARTTPRQINGKAIDRSHHQNELGRLARLAAHFYSFRRQIIWNSQLGFYGSPGVYGPLKQVHNHLNYEASAVDQLGCTSDNESHFYQFPKGIKYCSYELSGHSYFKHHENQVAGLDFNWSLVVSSANSETVFGSDDEN
ncbi:hypothetical protein HRR94_003952 [Exophiala dermatitidis]|nr:hypothetical protein HRR94_003952 [Exophiala dermatitidis]